MCNCGAPRRAIVGFEAQLSRTRRRRDWATRRAERWWMFLHVRGRV